MTRLRPYFLFCLMLLIAACANRGIGPQGGPKDVTPPAVKKSKPENGALNFKGQKVKIRFNEYVVLENIPDNVIISPPQKRPAEVMAIGKTVQVTFPDTLRDNTTYTINFGSAIKDNNEKNPLDGYSFAFATGPEMDSLEIHGIVLNAENLSPVPRTLVGIHENHSDSVFSKEPFTRIGVTNDDGTFTIHNIHPGTYRLYALQDGSRDYIYQTGEPLAFSDTLYTPKVRIETRYDTIFRDSVIRHSLQDITLTDSIVLTDSLLNDSTVLQIPDSVIISEYHLFEPSGIVLFLFSENKQQHYINKPTRKQPHCFTLTFSAPAEQMPQITPLPLHDGDTLALWTHLQQTNRTRDTFTYWLTDSAVISRDSLRMAVTYLKSDSLFNLVPQTDTLYAIYRQTIADRNASKKQANDTLPPRPEPLVLRTNAGDKFNVFDTLLITAKAPVSRLITDSLHFYRQQDSLALPEPFTLIPHDSAHITYALLFDLQPNTTYMLTADTAAFTDIYNHANDSTTWTLTTKAEEDYAKLILHIEEHDTRLILQLLDDKDNPLRTIPLPEPDITLTHLLPVTYGLRLFLDLNQDGRWTTGDWMLHRQPEPVFYFPKKLTLKENWDFEETFQWKTVPLLEQKPK